MATYYFDGDSLTNGVGTIEDPFNTFVGIPTGAHTYLLKRGSVFREIFTLPAGTNNCVISAYGDTTKELPTFNCENTRADGINLNTRIGVDISFIRFINQNAGPNNAAVRISGSSHKIHDCIFSNCYTSIHLTNSANNRIYKNKIDIGNALTRTIAYGIRLNSTGCINNLVYDNYLYSTANLTFGTTIELFNAGAGNWIIGNKVFAPFCDGPSLRNNTTGSYLVSNLIAGARILDALVCEGSSNNFIWNNTSVNFGDLDWHFGPALKMGNEFGAGTPSDFNDVANNLFISWGRNNIMNLVTIGTNNTFRNNLMYAPRSTNIINLNTGSGTSALNFAQWQATGYSTNDVFALPEINDNYTPKSVSNLNSSTVDLGWLRDVENKYNRKYIGAFAPVIPKLERL